MFFNSGPIAGASQNHKHMQVVPVKSLPNSKIPIQERVMDAFQRSQVSETQGEAIVENLVEDSLSQANYDNLGLRKRTRQSQMFILPEYQQIQHIFKRIDPKLVAKITDDRTLEAAAL